MLRRVALIATGTLLLGIGGLAAQDYTLPPLSGEIKLADGFLPDPYATNVTAGGQTQLTPDLGEGCTGFVSHAPNLRVYYTSGANPLVISAESTTDIVLAVNTPDGVWHCNDDTNGTNPELTFDTPLGGQYDIWVGTYSSSGTADAMLFLSAAATTGGGAGALDYTLPAINGVTELRAGFTPDPFQIDVTAGGEADGQTVDDNCYGFTTAAPTLSLQYTAGSFPLFIAALSDEDTLLLINDPAGNWICDDDSAGNLNPLVTFDEPATGRYDIWVATFGGTAPATIYISETAAPEGDVTTSEDNRLNWDLTPGFGEATLEAGFTPAPHVVEFQAGGPIAVPPDQGEGCLGYATAEPTYRIQYTTGGVPLSFTVTAQGDTTLIIADPNGTYVCNDDLNGFDPGITFDPGLGGQYDIWVATYDPGQTIAGTLTIAEIGEAITALDYTIDPVAGEATLAAGFTPDPYTVAVPAGGPISAYTAAGDPCNGYVTEGPTFRLQYTAGAFPLAIWAEAVGDDDLTIVINDPNGDWYCDDDGAGNLNPAVLFAAPVTGQYDIWVGTYGQGGGPVDATLLISETVDPTAFESSPDSPPSPGSTGALDFTAEPIFGAIDLAAGFTPDPVTVAIDAGGDIPADQADPSCRGFVTAAPTYRLTYTAGAYPLAIWAQADGADITLVVNGPDGNWICDDDAGEGFNPAILLDTPAAGQYDIWVGTYGGGTVPATLLISEITNPIEDASAPIPSPPPPPSLPPPPSVAPPTTGQLDFTLPPTFGEVTLATGFIPDPHQADVQAGGDIDAELAADPACRGSVAAAPSFRLQYTAATAPLIFKVLSEADTTLVINLPDGTWLCDDDGGEGLNPLVTIEQPLTGQYDVWVGTYGGGALQAATLLITEIAGSP